VLPGAVRFIAYVQTDSHTVMIRGTKCAPSKDGLQCTHNSPSSGQPSLWMQKGVRETTVKYIVLAGPVQFIAGDSSFRKYMILL